MSIPDDAGPRTEPLSAEEEADWREHFVDGSGAFVDSRMMARMFATLDAAREQAATEARRELLAAGHTNADGLFCIEYETLLRLIRASDD